MEGRNFKGINQETNSREPLICESVPKILSYPIISLRVQWKLLTILTTSNKSVWTNVSWYVKVCIFWKCIQYTINWNKTQMLKKFISDKMNGTRNALFFLSRAPTHHSFTFNLRFLHELQHNVRLSKTVCRVFLFWFHFVFINISVQQNARTLWL